MIIHWLGGFDKINAVHILTFGGSPRVTGVLFIRALVGRLTGALLRPPLLLLPLPLEVFSAWAGLLLDPVPCALFLERLRGFLRSAEPLSVNRANPSPLRRNCFLLLDDFPDDV